MIRPNWDRLTVWKETQQLYNDFPSRSSTIYHDFSEDECAPLVRRFTTEVSVVNGDCIDVAIMLKHEGYNPLLLNMACWRRAGGMVEFGSAAQEEECFRRSNYFKHLHQSYYPPQKFDTFISKGVEYYCGSIRDGYKLLESPVQIDMIAAPAVENPAISRNGREFTEAEDIAIMEKKIHQLFWIGAKEGNDVLVLSAWGCGAYGCPPEHVARIFKKVCEEQSGLFKKVVFAILGSNEPIFQRVFQG